ncbi:MULTISPECIES: hypothetical protein [unclassified Lysobacter]|uniref:hypothetical protein n=1 Tax=unclassified Lysobacter TaxID=2635362 RepID=UPI00203617F8|nr:MULTISPECIES: hypothetical protein [unclassified Lysobacter]
MTVAPPERSAATPARGRLSLFSWLMLALGTFGFAAFWVLLSLAFDRQYHWMAVIGALDIAWMLRLAGWRPGPRRALAALIATALIIVTANWGIAAGQIGVLMGLDPVASAAKLGPHFFWNLFQLANSGLELVWLAIALAVAALASR